MTLTNFTPHSKMATSDSDVHWVNVDSVPVSSSGIDSINCGQVAMII